MNRLQKYIGIQDTNSLKTIVWNKYRSVTPKIIDERNMRLRFSHCERVADISFQLLQFYMEDIKNTKKLSKKEIDQLKYIKKYKLENSVIFLGLIHDMYKFAETNKTDHSELVATFFKNYCKRNKVKMKNHVELMYEALRDHSDKSINKSDNIYYKILTDADVLSKYFEENIHQKTDDGHAKEVIIKLEKELHNDKFKGKTPYYNELHDIYKRALLRKISTGEFNKRGD